MNKIKKLYKNENNILLFIFITIFVGVSISLKLSGMSGNDFWWHLKSGEWIVHNKKIPTTALFTWYGQEQNLNWFAHEWLTEVLFYGIYSAFGQIGMYEFCLLTGIIIIICVFYINKEYFFNNTFLSFIYMFYFTLVVTLFFYGRPHTINMIFLFILLAMLYQYKKKSSKIIYALPVFSVIWVNFHGGSSNLIYIMPILFIIGSIKNINYGKLNFTYMGSKKIIRLSLITLISTLSLCINPRGFEMIKYPFTNMADSTMLNSLSEWMTPDIKDLGILFLCFIPVILVAVIITTTSKKIDAVDFLIFGFYTYMFLRSQRFISLFVIATSFFTLKYAMPFNKNKKKKKITSSPQQNILIFTTTFIFFISLLIGQFINAVSHSDTLIPAILPKEYAEFIKEDNPQRLYNDYDCGGPLIYHEIPVFVDGRADIYTGDTLKNYQTLKHCRNYNDKKLSNDSYMEDLLKEYKFDAFFVGKKWPIYNYLINHPNNYDLVKSDKEFAYFKTKTK